MERIENVNMEELNGLIAAQEAQALSEMWGDWDLTDKIDAQGFPTENPSGTFLDRRTREHVSYYQAANGSFQPSRLKRYDHVLIVGVIPVVVAMAARGRNMFLAYAPEWYGPYLMAVECSTISDRAPVNPLEPPMPINAPPPLQSPPPPPPPSGEVTIDTTITSGEHQATLHTTVGEDGIEHTHDA